MTVKFVIKNTTDENETGAKKLLLTVFKKNMEDGVTLELLTISFEPGQEQEFVFDKNYTFTLDESY